MSKVITKIQNYIRTKTDKTPECSFETDINTITHNTIAFNGATVNVDGFIVADAVGEGIAVHFYLDDKVAIDVTNRPIVSTVSWIRADAGADTVDGGVHLAATKADGSEITQWITGNGVPWDAISFDACAIGRYEKYQYTWETGYDAGDHIILRFTVQEAAKTFWFLGMVTRYFVKRILT